MPRLILLLLSILLVASPVRAAPQTTSGDTDRIVAAMERKSWDDALGLIRRYLERRPEHPYMLYNLACCHARLGHTDDATGALFRAVKAGFREFDHLANDPDLESIRGEEMYLAILEAAERTERERANGAIDRWKREYGADDYRFEIDRTRRLAFATSLDKTSHDEMRALIAEHADLLLELLFEEPPSYYVLIAVPTTRDADRFFEGDRSIGGMYEHAQRRLVTRDIGVSLLHEFVHALHYGHMERRDVSIADPIWVVEGLATLFETYERDGDGKVVFLPNERTNIARNRARRNRLTKWRTLFEMDAESFMRRSGQLYPEVRAIFEYFAREGKLGAWYRAYVETAALDRSGVLAVETAFGESLDQVEKDYRNWMKTRAPVDMTIEPGDASLGIEGRARATSDGVEIARVWPGSSARRAGLRAGDVIVALDELPTRSLSELQRLIAARKVSEVVTVRIRRSGRYQNVRVTLQALRRVG